MAENYWCRIALDDQVSACFRAENCEPKRAELFKAIYDIDTFDFVVRREQRDTVVSLPSQPETVWTTTSTPVSSRES
jgi:hypothetical protein